MEGGCEGARRIFGVDCKARQICRGEADGRGGKRADGGERREVGGVEVGCVDALAVVECEARGAQQERNQTNPLEKPHRTPLKRSMASKTFARELNAEMRM